jgi:hypothetical protein
MGAAVTKTISSAHASTLRGRECAIASVEYARERQRARARELLNRSGVRKFVVDDSINVGVWSDLDGPEIRTALRMLDSDHLPVRYLDGSNAPLAYKVRHVAGEPVPLAVLAAMERHPEPWIVRDRMLRAMRWCPTSRPSNFRKASAQPGSK